MASNSRADTVVTAAPRPFGSDLVTAARKPVSLPPLAARRSRRGAGVANGWVARLHRGVLRARPPSLGAARVLGDHEDGQERGEECRHDQPAEAGDASARRPRATPSPRDEGAARQDWTS